MAAYELEDLKRSTVCLGKRGENGVTVLQFDLTDWYTDHPAGTAAIHAIRPTESETDSYDVSGVAASGDDANILEWTVDDTDTAVAGKGWAELYLTEDTTVQLYPFHTLVEWAIGDTSGAIAAATILTTAGDMLTYTTEPARLGIGTAGYILRSTGTAPAWAANAAANVSIADSGVYFSGTNVETALQELGPQKTHTHGNITNVGAIGTTADLPVWTTTSGVMTTKTVAASQAMYTLFNPNLLHNWDFRAPCVDQRGEANYSTTGYCVDRWEITSIAAGGFVQKSTAHLTIDCLLAADVCVVTQIIENGLARLNGKTVTLSVMVYGGEVSTETYTPALETGVEYTGDNFAVMYNEAQVASADLYMNSSDELMVRIAVAAGARAYIAAVKLELGSISTIAADPPMDYDKEYNTCLRFYEKLGGTADAPVATGSQYNDIGMVHLNYVPKRVAPAITFAGTHQLLCKSTSSGAHKLFAVTGLSCAKAANGLSAALLQVETTDADNAGEGCTLCGASDGSAYIYITADL